MDKGTHGRRDRLVKQKQHDVYRPREKWPEPTQCTQCGAAFMKGRWSWDLPQGRVNKAVCPACRRIADGYPAGIIEIKGAFFDGHRDEMVRMMRNVEELEKDAHPLERIMAVTEDESHTLVTTTGVHLARRLGEALARAYKGDLSFQYGDGEQSIRLQWQR